MTVTTDLTLSDFGDAVVVVPAPGAGPGNWAGAASAIHVDGVYWLTYRVRRPLDVGRGVTVVVARSRDGEHFEPVAEVHRDAFGAESFERPSLQPTPDGWRLYLSCATPNSKHWWIEAVEAATVEDLPYGERTIVLPGDDTVAVKDPVIVQRPDGWHMWVCCHPLTDRGQEDRMTTAYATSDDGLRWIVHREVLRGRPGQWDARGARVVAVLAEEPLTLLYDGRPRAEDNWHETTGIARQVGNELVALGDAPIGISPYSDGAFRYASVVELADGRRRFYVEAARPDGAHDLVTFVR